MPRFISNSGSFQDLIVTGSRLYVASSSIFLNNLVTSSTAISNVLVISSSGQIYFTASSALPSTTQTVPTPTFIATGSVSASVNVGPTSFQVTSGSSTFMIINNSGSVTITGNNSGSVTITGSVANRSTQITPSGLYISRTSNGDYVSSITANGNMFYNTRNSHQFKNQSTNSLWIFESGNVQIATQAGDLGDTSGYKLYISGSDTSGSFNANNILYVSSSNVGVGLLNPQTRLDVTSSFRVSGGNNKGQLTVYSDDAVNIGPESAVGNALLRLYGGTNNGTGTMYFGYNAAYAGEIAASGTGRIIINPVSESLFLISGTERMRLNSAGNLQISASVLNADSGYKVFIDQPGTSGSLNVSNTLYVSASNVGIGATSSLYKLQVSGSGASGSFNANNILYVSQSTVSVTGSTNVLKVIGSGSTQPLFSVVGSLGELFTVTDNLSGSLFSVNDISGLPILDVNSDQTTKIGSYLAPGMYASTRVTANTGVTVIYSIPTASYDSAYFDYNIRSGSVGRAGQIMAMWSGSSVNYSEVSASSFGTTNTFVFGVSISGSNMILSGSAPSNGWTVKTIVKAI